MSKRQFNQNYQQLVVMNQFERIFERKLSQTKISPTIPVSCSLAQIYQAQKDLLASAKLRKETVEEKNKRIAEENLKYRNQLKRNMTLLQQKHDKNRRNALTKIVKSEEHRDEYRKNIFSKHKNNEKQFMREKISNAKQFSQKMQQYWANKKVATQKSFRTQSAAKPIYWDTVQRKKSLERQEIEKGMSVKSELMRKHSGREGLVHNYYQTKRQEVHEPHTEQVQKTVQRNMELLDSKIKSLINSIGDDFRKSGEVLKSQRKTHEKKLKDRLIDEQDHRLTIKSNLKQRVKQRSASLAECNCKRINNIEQSYTKSVVLKQSARHTHFGDTLKKLQREPSEPIKRNNQFLAKSQSFRSTVSYNKSLLHSNKLNMDTDRLRREKEISDALLLKKSLEVEGNCYVRKIAAN